MTNNLAANGTHTTNGTPHSFTTLTPFLVITDATEALRFYQEVFGAKVLSASELDGVVVHAELQFDQGRLQLGAPNPEYQLIPRPDGEGDCYSLSLYCADVDATVERAVADGATVREPAMTFVSGDRFASVRDPFGVRWSIMTRVEDLSDEESARRVEEWVTQQG